VNAKGHPNVPHVDGSDPRYNTDRPRAHGRFTGGFGPQHVFVPALNKAGGSLAERLWRGDRERPGERQWAAPQKPENLNDKPLEAVVVEVKN
jgi:hypothetical protein